MCLFCPICDCPCPPDDVICDDCKRELDYECLDNLLDRCPNCFSPRVDRIYRCPCGGSPTAPKVYSVARYDGKLGYSVMDGFKFHGRKEFAPVIARYLKQALVRLDPDGRAMIVPIPCSEARRRLYGWDHMVEVAKALGRPYVELLRNNLQAGAGRDEGFDQREGAGGYAERNSCLEQKRLDRLGRMERSRDRFSLNPRIGETKLCRLRASPIIVIDDIVTTGSTMASAMDTLKGDGFADVSGASWLCEL